MEENLTILLDNSDYIAQKYYYVYRNYFASKAFDLEDLEQEAKMIVLDIYDKYSNKDIKELKKLCNQAIGWKFNILLRDVVDKPIACEFNEELFPPLINQMPDILFNSLEEVLDEKEFDILEMKFKKNMTLEEIGLELNLTKMRVSQILKGIYKYVNFLIGKRKNFTFIKN